MRGKAYIVFWVNMTTCKVEKAGVYSEPSPTMMERATIPLVYATFQGEDYESASAPAERALQQLLNDFPELPVKPAPPTPSPDVPLFYCGRCKRHMPHRCSAAPASAE